MNREELNGVIKDAVNDSELMSSELPSFALYVDQILNLVADKQKEGSHRIHDKQLKKTMINNYSKDRVIAPVKGKKYTKEQIVQILMVNTLKGVLSIGEIKHMLHGAYTIEGFGEDSLTELYDRYMHIKSENRDLAAEVLDGMLEANQLDVSKDEDYLAAVGALVSLSGYLKNIAQAMIEAKYPEPIETEKPEEEEDSKKEKDKEKDKEKKKKEKESKEKEKDKEKKKEKKKDLPEIEISDN